MQEVSPATGNPFSEMPRSERLRLSLLEIPYVLKRLRTTFEQRRQITIYEGQQWIETAQALFTQPNSIFTTEQAHISSRLAAGFSFTTFRFTTDKGEWILKVGAALSPVPGYFHPSSLEYTKNYSRNLNILRKTFSEQLPNLIPEPQFVLYADKGDASTTLVIEPFISNILGFDKLDTLELAQQEGILEELNTFDLLCREMKRDYGVLPDIFGGKNNFAIAFSEGIPHLILLDNELTDIHAPSPVYNTLNRIKYILRIAKETRRLTRIVRRHMQN